MSGVNIVSAGAQKSKSLSFFCVFALYPFSKSLGSTTYLTVHKTGGRRANDADRRTWRACYASAETACHDMHRRKRRGRYATQGDVGTRPHKDACVGDVGVPVIAHCLHAGLLHDACDLSTGDLLRTAS